ncbi:DMT family transporter [Lacticaseibacillus baoqingensis]|uniref:DMT family transporter n=1 Tax=Lacticaseibacillus baoqingensis TaxID=2486013 RepID=A0ABW4E4F2_9LACO|nr:DMT family transporter [Lacticaseibacillus baoqingensis]
MTGKQKGLACAILGPVLWGVSGNIAQWLFDDCHLRPDWLVAVRLLAAGALLMGWCLATRRQETLQLVHQPRRLRQALAFGVFGILVSQFTYFAGVAASNAPTITVLQYLGPLFIVLYLAVKHWRWPSRIDVLSLIVAFVGIILLVTHGHLGSLALSPAGIFWGIGAGLGAALYTLLPVQLLKVVEPQIVIAWAMLFAGVLLSPLIFLLAPPSLTLPIVLGIVYVTVFGTLFAYLLYLQSLKYLQPTMVGMLNVFEPLTATVVAVLCFHSYFGGAEIIGGLLVLSTSFIQVWPTRHMLTANKRHAHN